VFVDDASEDAMAVMTYESERRQNTGAWPSRQTLKRGALATVAALAIVAAAAYGYDYVTTGRYLESTDDAYVQADSTLISPKVSGYIAEVLVNDNQPVKAGQVLARIDDRDFKASLEQAQADVASADAAVRNLDAQIALQQPVIEQATADVGVAEANLQFAQEEQTRYQGLMKTGSGTIQRAQQTDAALRAQSGQLQHDKFALVAAQKKVDVLTTDRARAVAQLAHARAVESQAALNLSYTNITAPVDGTVGARSLRVGQFVQAGTQLMAVVPLNAVYVVANFKETQLAHVRDGQPVELRVDSFRGEKLRGHVDSVSPASGLEFALLPPDNATGNFTKVVQRVPVKITLDDNRLAGLLRPGTSVEPTINTKATVIAEQQQDQPHRVANNAGSRPGG